MAPPGQPEDWAVDATDVGADSHRVHVVVPLWTREERPVRAYLALVLTEVGAGRWRPIIHDLYRDA